MTPEARILELAEQAQEHLDAGVVRCDHLSDALSPSTVKAMARVVEAVRRLKEDEDYVPIAMMARWSGLYAALAALDAEGEK